MMARSTTVRWSMGIGIVLTAACASAGTPATSTSSGGVTSIGTTRSANAEVFAINYGTLERFRVSGLIAGADTGRRMDIALMVWLIKRDDGRNVLVDAGFYREKFMTRWKPANYITPSEAVRLAGVAPEAVTDIIVSHVHWDHADGIDLFPNARVWIQREEFEHHVSPEGRVRDRAIDSLDAAMLDGVSKAGRIRFVDGDDQEIMPGIRVHTGGKHTFASQFASVVTRAGTIVLASDNAYLYENLDTRRPIAQTLDTTSNLRAQERMKVLAASPRLIVPGHDPAVMTRFETVRPRVVRVR